MLLKLKFTVVLLLAALASVNTFAAPAASEKQEIKIPSSVPLNEAGLSDKIILDWTKSMAIDIKSYNFANSNEHFEDISVYFTTSGWDRYFKFIKERKKELEAVKLKRLIVSATLKGEPVILVKGVNDNIYFWQIKVPVLITYQSTDNKINDQTTMTFLLIRCTSNKANICIDQLDEISSNQSSI